MLGTSLFWATHILSLVLHVAHVYGKSRDMQHTKKELCENPSQIWTGLSQSLQAKPISDSSKAGLYTPYNIVPGGGERYLLSAAAVFQALNYHVTLMTNKKNVCKTKTMLLDVVKALEVPLAPSNLSYELVAERSSISLGQKPTFEVFFLLGNEKLPELPGLGKVNIYMCQFPFDMHRQIGKQKLGAFTTYDYVLVNSKYTYRHYNSFARSAFIRASRLNAVSPLVSVLYPPVARMSAIRSEIPGKRKDIVMIGRIFSGRQNKGYVAAIRMFQQVSSCVPNETQLNIIGTLMPGHSKFYNKLQELARGFKLRIHFNVNADRSHIMNILSSSIVQWHLTGIDSKTSDPASEEHFGLSVVEGMHAGVIPVVINKGGLGEIVENASSGFIGENEAEVVTLTCSIFQKSSTQLARLKKAATVSAKSFTYKIFSKNLRVVVQRAFLSKPFRHLIKRTQHIVHNRTFELPLHPQKIAMIIEDRQHFSLEYVVKNVLYHLGTGWGLLVVHTRTNSFFVHAALSSIKNVNYHELEQDHFSVEHLNMYMKRAKHWDHDAEKVLFFQTDSLLLHGNISKFLQYDYIGPPWHVQNKGWSMIRSLIPSGVGNGGVSLRSTSAMRRIPAHFGHLSPSEENEDVFFVKRMQNSTEYRLPSRGTAYEFGLEVPCSDIEKKTRNKNSSSMHRQHSVPLALHATWYYLTNTMQMKRLQQYLEISLCSGSTEE